MFVLVGAGLGIALWAVAAFLLWNASVVPQLHLSGLDVHRYFTPQQLHRASSYERIVDWLWLCSTLVTLLALAVYARYGALIVRRTEASDVTAGMMLGVLGVALVWLVGLPFALVETWWDRRHGFSKIGYLDALFGNWLGLGGALIAVITLFVVMLAARRFGERWWLVAVPCFVALYLLEAFVTPYVLPSLHPLRNSQVAASARALERRDGLDIPIEVENVQRETSLANSEAVGLGPSRRIVIWNTLLDGRFTNREIRVVVAHELGHQRRHHIWKEVAWEALFLIPIAFAIILATRRRGGMGRPEAIPLALLVLTVAQLVLTPARNAVSRHFEQEADWVALQTTNDKTAARGLFVKLATTSDDEPDPTTWAYLMLDDHPTIAQRIAMVNAAP
ncbi:MAG TPA: M48 family metalloprotease [Gaiellaceae bacterium]|nr:M48 family metalloprotease [Gaiellaceae bacterium]